MAEHAWRGVTTPGRPQLCRSGCGLRPPVASASVSPQRSLTGGCAEAGSQHGSPWLGSRGRAERVLPPPGPGWPGASMPTLEVGRGRAERRWLPRQRRRCLGLRAARPHTRPGPGSPQCGHAPAAAPSRRTPPPHTHTQSSPAAPDPHHDRDAALLQWGLVVGHVTHPHHGGGPVLLQVLAGGGGEGSAGASGLRVGTPRAGLYPLDRTEMPAARGGRRLRGRQRQERPSRCSGGPGPRPAQPISAPRGVSGLRRALFSRQNSQGPRQPTRAPHSEKPSRPGGHERSTEGCVQTPHWGLRPGRGRCRRAGRPRCRGTAQGQRTWAGRAAETSGLAHPPSAPAAGEKVKTVHSQARGIYTQRRGGGCLGVPLHQPRAGATPPTCSRQLFWER